MPARKAATVALKEIVVFLDGSQASDVRLEIALEIASRHDALLAGAYVPEESILARYPDEFARGDAVADVVSRETSAEDAGLARAASHFMEASRKAGVSGEWRPIAKYGTAADVVRCARYAELSIVGQFAGRGASALWRPEELLFAFGGPALIVPQETPPSHRVGRHVLIAWDASREAKRAVADAMPFLAAADRTTILVVDPQGQHTAGDHGLAAALAARLKRHGIDAAMVNAISGGRNIGSVILEQAKDAGADMIVMGAYGHMRVIEMIFGGATRTVLADMAVPVLMSR